MGKKIITRVSKEDFIQMVSDMTAFNKNEVKIIYDALENALYEQIWSTNEYHTLEIKIFDGLTIKSKYIPRKTKKNNLTGNIIHTFARIKPKATFTRSLLDKLMFRD